MKLKKLTAIFVVVAMMATMLFGCGNPDAGKTTVADNKTTQGNDSTGEGTEAPTEAGDPLYNVGSLPIVNEKITLKVLTQDATGKAWESADKSGYWAWLEEKTGIHFEVESYAKEELASKLSLIMATPDEMPDIFLNVGFDASKVQQYGLSGQLLMLDDYIEQYGTNTKEVFAAVDGALGGAKSADGHIYSLPYISMNRSASIYVLNSRFMENAGLDPEKDAPKTIEELYEVFKAIQKADANGDGIVGNEICWSSTTKDFYRGALSMVGIACYWPVSGCVFDQKNDEVFFVPTSEEYKYLLSWLSKFYEEGMLDQELFTQTSEQRNAKNKADLVFMNHTYDDPENSNYAGRSGAFFLDAPLTSAVSDKPLVATSALYNPDIAAISAYTEYPEVCMLLLDYFYSAEASKTAKYGLDGVDYKFDESGFAVTASSEWVYGSGPTTLMVNYWDRIESKPAAPKGTTLAQRRTEYCTDYSAFAFQNYLKFTDEQSNTLATLTADLGLYCDDYFVGVITGNYDLEKTWDDYVKKCEGMQLAEITKIYQDAYNVFFGIK